MGENTTPSSETEEQAEYECEACGRSFESHEALVEHMCDVGQVG